MGTRSDLGSISTRRSEGHLDCNHLELSRPDPFATQLSPSDRQFDLVDPLLNEFQAKLPPAIQTFRLPMPLESLQSSFNVSGILRALAVNTDGKLERCTERFGSPLHSVIATRFQGERRNGPMAKRRARVGICQRAMHLGRSQYQRRADLLDRRSGRTRLVVALGSAIRADHKRSGPGHG